MKCPDRKINRYSRFYVYIVECNDKTYYTGYTNDLKARIMRHNQGLASKYTRTRLPVKLVWSKEYRYFRPACKAERIIKQLTRKEKESLVGGRRLDKILYEKSKNK